MASGRPFLTKAEFVEESLRDRLLRGEYLPGRPLRVETLAQEFLVSHTPVKEALRKLAAQGFLTYEPHHGARVRELTLREARDVFSLRQLLEGEAAERAAGNLSVSDVRRLRRLQVQMLAASRAGAAKRMAQLSRDFHMLIYAGAGSPRLLAFIETLWAGFPRPLLWHSAARESDSIAEHDELIDALVRGDGRSARELTERHLEGALAFVISRVSGGTVELKEDSA